MLHGRLGMQSYRCNSSVKEMTWYGILSSMKPSKLTIIGSDNGLSPGRRQAIIWTNSGILLIRIPGTNFSDILSEIQTFSFSKMHSKMSYAVWLQCCLGLNVLIYLVLRSKYYFTTRSFPWQLLYWPIPLPYQQQPWHRLFWISALIARFMGPTWGPSGADRTQVGPMFVPWTLLSGWFLVFLKERFTQIMSCKSWEINLNANQHFGSSKQSSKEND